MPKTINPIRKNIVKQAILEGKSYRKGLEEANYSKATIHNSGNNTVVKQCVAEISKAFDIHKIDENWIIEHIEQEATQAPKSSDRIAALALLAKWKALLTDKSQVSAEIINKEEESILNRFINHIN